MRPSFVSSQGCALTTVGLAEPLPRCAVSGGFMSEGYTSNEFQAVRKALLACKDDDGAYLRRWILRWVTSTGTFDLVPRNCRRGAVEGEFGGAGSPRCEGLVDLSL